MANRTADSWFTVDRSRWVPRRCFDRIWDAKRQTTPGCGLAFFGSPGNRKGLDTCAPFAGVDSPPPSRPSNSDGVATWLQYQTALGTWAQNNARYLPVSQQQELKALRADADATEGASWWFTTYARG